MGSILPAVVLQNCIEIVISIPIIAFNGLFMIALVKKKTLHNPSNAVLGCLCCSDLVMGILSFFMLVPLFFWIFGYSSPDDFHVYDLVFGVRSVFGLLSMIFIMLVNIDRYAAICHPFKYLQYATPTLFAAIGLCTCLVAIVLTSASIAVKTIYKTNSIYVIAIIVFVAIASALIYCNMRIIRVTQRHSREIASRQGQGDGQYSRYQNEKRRYRIVVLLVIIFVLCKLPNVILVFFIAVVKMKITISIYIFSLVSNTIFLLDSLINPIVYYFRLQVFRNAIKTVFCSQRQV